MIVLNNLWKQLKKKWKLRRRRFKFGVFLLLAGVCLIMYNQSGLHVQDVLLPQSGKQSEELSEGDKQQKKILLEIEKSGLDRETIIRKHYICGEEEQRIGKKKAEEIIKLHQSHPDWQMLIGENGNVLFTQDIEDLSPACKQNAYFGIDQQGNFSLFEGEPKKEQVLRTFFQLNIHSLESSLPKETVDQLYEGIRVKDVAEYNSVLSTFGDYAVEETEKVMSPAGHP
ncbi:BofC C-terminal domain-containing protein [Paenibacillus larvae]|uniref:BofC C-terminal domain-containing protein n=1 Tax=Paenibacillus larvae TaxID=1464 RepID=UPI00227E4D0A|nr:BofC C-terminal domain-containing protein [Paenibacillus larvae]MCY9510741.1 BofC C-terminal domain-containing protein [Paenibacillus larvae]MCY9524073.1 BofC C-terminal domain-containing protein [Paenibacillus larvae]